MQKYKELLAVLCVYSAELAKMKIAVENGEVISNGKLRILCKKIAVAKELLLEEKERLGFTDGLLFMEDNNFAGFSIVDGCLVGDTDNLYAIVTPMYENFPEGANNYQYEVANLLLAFMHKGSKEHKPQIQEKKRKWVIHIPFLHMNNRERAS